MNIYRGFARVCLIATKLTWVANGAINCMTKCFTAVRTHRLASSQKNHLRIVKTRRIFDWAPHIPATKMTDYFISHSSVQSSTFNYKSFVSLWCNRAGESYKDVPNFFIFGYLHSQFLFSFLIFYFFPGPLACPLSHQFCKEIIQRIRCKMKFIFGLKDQTLFGIFWFFIQHFYCFWMVRWPPTHHRKII